MPTAILIDGGYFVRRYRALVSASLAYDTSHASERLFTWALAHLGADTEKEPRRQLHRIFFYDCPPLTKKLHHPLTHQPIDLSKSPEAVFRQSLHRELVKLRKLALRRGRLSDLGHWALRPDKLKALLRGDIAVSRLQVSDVFYESRQKGVDMRIGIDIATLALRKLVDQIVLFAGDADFVPAAKLARREGIDFILDPMWGSIPEDLHEHIDGLRSTCPKPQSSLVLAETI